MLFKIIIGLFIVISISPFAILAYDKMRAQKNYHYHLVRFLEKYKNNGVKYSNMFLIIPDEEREEIEKKAEADIKENGLTESTILIYQVNLDRIIAEGEEMAKDLVDNLNRQKALKAAKKEAKKNSLARKNEK